MSLSDIQDCGKISEIEIEKSDEKFILKLRCEQKVKYLCKSHYITYVTMFSFNKKTCSNPHDDHKKKSCKYRLSEVTLKLRSDVDLVGN